MRWRDRTIIGMSVAGLCVGLLIGGCSKSEKPLTAQTPMALELMSADENAPGIEEALERGIDDTFEQVVVGPQDDGTYIVATTQRIDPAGESVAFPGRPTDLALSPDGATIAGKPFLNGGGIAGRGPVIVGVRPEDVMLAEPGAALFDGRIEFTEPYGGVIYAFITLDSGTELLKGREHVVVSLDVHQPIAVGSQVGVNFRANRANLFDASTGQAMNGD